MAVATRAHKIKKEDEIAIQVEKERKSGAIPNPVMEETPTQEEEVTDIENNMPGAEFADELEGGPETGRQGRKSVSITSNLYCSRKRDTH